MAQITNANAIRDVELILYSGRPHYEARNWTAAGVECRRDRHRYTGQGYAFSVEVLQLRPTAGGRPTWELMIVSERWATGMPETVIRGQKWMKLVSGKPEDVRSWIRRHRPMGVAHAEAKQIEGPDLDI